MNKISQDKIKDYVWYYAFLPLKSKFDKELQKKGERQLKANWK